MNPCLMWAAGNGMFILAPVCISSCLSLPPVYKILNIIFCILAPVHISFYILTPVY